MRLSHFTSQRNKLVKPLFSAWTPPVFLCPALLTNNPRSELQRSFSNRPNPCGIPSSSRHRQCDSRRRAQRRDLHVQFGGNKVKYNYTAAPTQSGLPLTCPGCGAYSQSENPDIPGYYDLNQKHVTNYLRKIISHGGKSSASSSVMARVDRGREARKEEEMKTYNDALNNLDDQTIDSLGLIKDAEAATSSNDASDAPKVPLCDRCHNLLNHSKGVSISHPDLETVRQIIKESPHKRDRIVHVIDAVDFPMSLIKGVHTALGVAKRVRNRRGKRLRHGFAHSLRALSLSLVVTRADLLAPSLSSAEKLLVRMKRILKSPAAAERLGKDVEKVRYAHIYCVSAMRGWFTKKLKEEIRHTEGATWLLGKVNVGKSKLIETIMPKKEVIDYKKKNRGELSADQQDGEFDSGIPSTTSRSTSLILPPAASEGEYPIMPITSHLPGTTVQPIRLRYGKGKGELIDLPGIDREDMTPFVKPDKQGTLVMRERVKAAQQVIRPGQSLMIGDLVRITPNWGAWNESITETRHAPEMVLLAAAFIPFKTHVTSTEKAIAGQAQERHSNGTYEELLADGAGTRIASAGNFALRWDETKSRAGPLTRSDAIGLKPAVLPFVVCSADIVLEGIGWVELSVQIRRRRMEELGATQVTQLSEHDMPSVEVFSPDGGHVLVRPSLSLFETAGQQRKPASQRSQRPRKSMKGAKKAEKARKRENLASQA